MNRIVNIVVFLLVLLHVLSLLCGCSRDAGQTETTDAGQSGTPLPAIRRHEHQKIRPQTVIPLCGLSLFIIHSSVFNIHFSLNISNRLPL